MKKINKFTLFGVILLWFLVLSPSVLGATEQFFPSAGTTIEYKLKYVINWSNGTTEETSKFEVWNVSGASYFVPMPMLVKVPGLFVGFNILESEVEVTLTRTYSDLSPTQLNRTGKLTANSTSFDENDGYVGIMLGKSAITGIATQVKLTSRAIDKTNYWDGAYNDFVDYFNKDAAIGEYVDFDHTVLSITDDSIVAFEVNPIITINRTYIADRQGKVNYYQYARTSPYPDLDADTVVYIWVRTQNSSSFSIPSYNVGIIITVTISTAAIYGMKIKKTKKSGN